MVKNAKSSDSDKSKTKNNAKKGQNLDIKEGSQNGGTTSPKEQAKEQVKESEATNVKNLKTGDNALSPEDIEKVTHERDDYLKHLQRLQADFDNYRKRIQKEKAQLRDFMVQDILTSLLDVIDNMDRALHPDNDTQDVDSYRQGVEMVFQQFINILKDQGLTRVVTDGKVFDPRFHEAIGQIETDEHEPGTIISEFLPGYAINERIIRAPKVQIAAQIKSTESDAPKENSGVKEDELSPK
jgi:molecular chaperone GrpE